MYPILISLGPIKIYSFGVFLVLAVVVGSFIIWREGRDSKFDEEKLIDLLVFEAIFGLAGARIYYLLFHLEEIGLNPFSWLLIFHFPGLSFLGAILGGLVGALLFTKKNGWSFWQVADFLVLGVSLGEGIGRIGAFFSGSAYGGETSLPWGVRTIGLLGKRHPVQLYEVLVAFLTFFLLLKLKKTWQEKNLSSGINFLLYVLIFGATRFLLEFLRGDSVYFQGWRTTQIVCLIFILGALVFLYLRLGRSLKTDFLGLIQKIKSRGKENV